MKIYLLSILTIVVLADNYTVQLNCTSCTGSNDTCFTFNGGGFDHAEIPLSDTAYASCSSPNTIRFPSTIEFQCVNGNACQNNPCRLNISSYAFTYCQNTSTAQSAIKSLNTFYSYYKGDLTFSTTYDWCNVCSSSGLPVWAIIVIAVGAVIVIALIIFGIWYWRKHKGGSSPLGDYANMEAATKLLK